MQVTGTAFPAFLRSSQTSPSSSLSFVLHPQPCFYLTQATSPSLSWASVTVQPLPSLYLHLPHWLLHSDQGSPAQACQPLLMPLTPHRPWSVLDKIRHLPHGFSQPGLSGLSLGLFCCPQDHSSTIPIVLCCHGPPLLLLYFLCISLLDTLSIEERSKEKDHVSMELIKVQAAKMERVWIWLFFKHLF